MSEYFAVFIIIFENSETSLICVDFRYPVPALIFHRSFYWNRSATMSHCTHPPTSSYIHTHPHPHTYTPTHMHPHTYTPTHTHTHTHPPTPTHIHTHTHTHTYTPTHTHIHAHPPTHMHTHTYTQYICTYICMQFVQ